MFIELLNPLPEGQYLDCAWPLTSGLEADMSLNTLKYAGYEKYAGYDATIEILPVLEMQKWYKGSYTSLLYYLYTELKYGY